MGLFFFLFLKDFGPPGSIHGIRPLSETHISWLKDLTSGRGTSHLVAKGQEHEALLGFEAGELHGLSRRFGDWVQITKHSPLLFFRSGNSPPLLLFSQRARASLVLFSMVGSIIRRSVGLYSKMLLRSVV